jgi:hypothetical protein
MENIYVERVGSIRPHVAQHRRPDWFVKAVASLGSVLACAGEMQQKRRRSGATVDGRGVLLSMAASEQFHVGHP